MRSTNVDKVLLALVESVDHEDAAIHEANLVRDAARLFLGCYARTKKCSPERAAVVRRKLDEILGHVNG